MLGWQDWRDRGARIAIELAGASHQVARHLDGAGPWLTLIHGFPGSSYDWADIWPALAARRRLLAVDLLGYGDSDKPTDHDYSLVEHADQIEAVWRVTGVERTTIVAHDIGMSITQE